MFRKLSDFLEAYKQLTEGTISILESLPENGLGHMPIEGCRSMSQLAWHIVTTIPEMMSQTGLGIGSVDPHSTPPDSKEDILTAYQSVSSELLKEIGTKWDDQTLDQEDNLYGENWKRSFTLTALIHHEIHHRGQMTILLRQANCAVPGMYGPSKEEWTKYGMEEPPY